MTGVGRLMAVLRLFLCLGYASAVQEQGDCDECNGKRQACEERAARWIATLAWLDDEIGLTISYLDYHRARSERRQYIESLRKRLLWLRQNMK
jgi:hypothetical protein